LELNQWDKAAAAPETAPLTAKVDATKTAYRRTPSPLRLLLIVAVSVFVSEALIMIFFFPMPAVAPLWAGILDAALITMLILPCLYFFLLRPLAQQIEERQRFETALSAANEQLEQRVQARTLELSQVNDALRQEVQERVRTEEALRQAHDQMEQQVQERTQALAQNNRELKALSQAEHDQRRLAEALAQATVALGSSLNLNDVLDQILEQIAQVTPYYAAAIFLLQDEWVEIPRHRRFSGEVHTHPLVAGFPLSAVPQLGAVAATRQPLLVLDTKAVPDWTPIGGLEWIRSCIIVPLVEGDHVIGFLATVSEEAGFFDEKSMAALTAFAAHATVAFQNAWLFQQVRAGHQRLQSLSHRLVEAQEAERRYVARELHDEAGQALISLLFGLRQLEKNADQPKTVISTALELRGLAEGVMDGLHRLAVNLRPAGLEQSGLVAALDAYTGRLAEQHDLQVRFKAVGMDERRLPLELETTLYRIAQETLTNVLRHAQASGVDVLLQRRGGSVTLVVEDDGVGFETAALQNDRLGLLGARERCEMLGGTLAIESSPGRGTTIVAEIPYADSDSVC
jgi:signal transduction histidine kinase